MCSSTMGINLATFWLSSGNYSGTSRGENIFEAYAVTILDRGKYDRGSSEIFSGSPEELL